MQKSCHRKGLKINNSKTETRGATKPMLNGILIKQAELFNYPGNTISENRGSEKKMQKKLELQRLLLKI